MLVEIFRPDRNTLALGSRLVNLFYRVVVVAAFLVLLGGVAVVLNYAATFGAELIDLDQRARPYIRAGGGLLYGLLVISSLVFGLADILQLYRNYFSRGADNDEDG